MGSSGLQAILGGAAGGLNAFAQTKQRQQEDQKSERREVRQEAREDRKDSMQERLFDIQMKKLGLELETIEYETALNLANGTPPEIAQRNEEKRIADLGLIAQQTLTSEIAGESAQANIRRMDALIAESATNNLALETAATTKEALRVPLANQAAAQANWEVALDLKANNNITDEQFSKASGDLQKANDAVAKAHTLIGSPPSDTAPAPAPIGDIAQAANVVSTQRGPSAFTDLVSNPRSLQSATPTDVIAAAGKSAVDFLLPSKENLMELGNAAGDMLSSDVQAAQSGLEFMGAELPVRGATALGQFGSLDSDFINTQTGQAIRGREGAPHIQAALQSGLLQRQQKNNPQFPTGGF